MLQAMIRSRTLIASAALMAGMMASGPAVAQFSVGATISGEVSRTVSGVISDAIRQNAQDALPPMTIRTSAGAVGAMSVSTAGRFMATAPSDGSVRIWDLTDGIEIRRIHGLSGTASAVSISADEQFVAAADSSGVKVWNLLSGKLLHELNGHAATPTTIAFGGTGNILMTGGADNAVIQWDVSTGQQVRKFDGHSAELRTIAFSSDGQTMATADIDGTIYIWDFDSGSAGSGFGPTGSGLDAMALSADGKWIATGARDGEVVLWERDGDRVGRFGAHDETLTTLAFSPDGKLLASADVGKEVWLWDTIEREDIFELKGHNGSIVGVTFEGRHSRLLSASEDGIVRAWNPLNGTWLAQMISTKSGWAVIDPDGRFDGSLDAVRDIAWTGDDGEIDLDRLSDRFYQTGLLPYMLDPKAPKLASAAPAQEEPEAKPEAAAPAPAPAPEAKAIPAATVRSLPPPSVVELKESLGDAPKIALLSPKNGETVEGESVEVTIQVIDEGSGVDEIRLFHNGRVVVDKGNRAATLTDRSGNRRLIHNFEVLLASGENNFSAVAFSSKRVESKPAKAKVSLQGAPKKPSLNVLAIGINTYKNPALSLNYGVPDAKGILKAFKNGSKDMFEKVNLAGVFDTDATKETILAEIRKLQTSSPDDVVVVYMAGHGELTAAGEWYFLPYDVVYPEREEQVVKYGVSSTQLQSEIAKIGGRKVMLLIDACKSGGAISAFRGFEERKAIRQLARSTGVHIVAATAQDQFAVELSRLNHGLFTYAVLEALAGGADGGRKDGFVSVREMLAYVEDRMPELSMQQRSSPQYPVINSRGMDFPVSIAQSN